MSINTLKNGLCALVLGAASMFSSGCATVAETKSYFNGSEENERSKITSIVEARHETIKMTNSPLYFLRRGILAIRGGIVYGLPEDFHNFENGVKSLSGSDVDKQFFTGLDVENPEELYK